jgi:hypothetical protein
MQTRIRFVGGPWHNQLRQLELCPEVIIRKPVQAPLGISTSLSWAGCFAETKEDRYFLAQCWTVQGTEYKQYVHQSLVRDGYADKSTYYERLPVWRINRRQLESRLRRAAGCLLKRRIK